jgi:WhiB family redox-sensing transcriptional regulator
MRLLGRGVYRCTVCGEVVRTTESDTLPVIEFIGHGERAERRVSVRGVEVHRCRLSDGTAVDIVRAGSRRWMDRALCARSPQPETWFPQEGESASLAKATCAVCPVAEPCLDYAIDNKIPAGIWGGQPAHVRRLAARRRSAREAGANPSMSA